MPLFDSKLSQALRGFHAFRLAFALGVAAVAFTLPADAKTVIDLQAKRHEEHITLPGDGVAAGKASLINLNEGVNVWYLLQLTQPGTTKLKIYNLANTFPGRVRLHLDKDFPHGVVLGEGDMSTRCELWGSKGGKEAGALDRARAAKRPYASLCNGLVLMKNQVNGRESFNEWCTDFLRIHVPGGESVITFMKNSFFQDKELITANTKAKKEKEEQAAKDADAHSPERAFVTANAAGLTLPAGRMGIALKAPAKNAMSVGKWYPSASERGVYVSQIEPRFVAPVVNSSFKSRADELDPVEKTAVVYLVAFDMHDVGLGYGVGTKHPGVEWSKRSPAMARLAKIEGGPDGFADVKPLVSPGIVAPPFLSTVLATFTGGFKRYHSAFKMGPFADKNLGSHYGFIEDGVMLSRMNEGLASMIATTDGKVEMKTWTKADDKRLGTIRYARQNGVALIVPTDPKIDHADPKLAGKPGLYVNQWGGGNWSGDMHSHKRTLRTGVCTATLKDRQFLMFGYFSDATPSAMARVFQAYGCSYGMHLDMNLPEHSYMALYHRDGGDYKVEHLTKPMAAFDPKEQGHVMPRFVAVPDSRDFFFLYRKDSAEDENFKR